MDLKYHQPVTFPTVIRYLHLSRRSRVVDRTNMQFHWQDHMSSIAFVSAGNYSQELSIGFHRQFAPGSAICSLHCSYEGGVSRRAILNALLVATFTALPANAVCGEPDPYFAHYLEWKEGFAKTGEKRSLHYRIVGSEKKERKAGKYPVLFLGDAGVGMTSGETLELLAGTNRRVILADFLGVGQSEKVYVQEMSVQDIVQLACQEVDSILRSARISNASQYHVIAAGFGIRVADALLESQVSDMPKIASVAVEGWSPITSALSFSELQGNRICALEGAEEGDIDIVRSLYDGKNSNIPQCIGRISNSVPTLALRSNDTQTVKEKFKGSKFKEALIPSAGRLAHLDSTEDCLSALESFLDSVDGHEDRE